MPDPRECRECHEALPKASPGGLCPRCLLGGILGEPDQMTRVLPIMIGLTEAQSIARFLTGTVNSRPCTHDLATTLMAAVGARLEAVVVTELSDGVFSAELFIEAADEGQSDEDVGWGDDD